MRSRVVAVDGCHDPVAGLLSRSVDAADSFVLLSARGWGRVCVFTDGRTMASASPEGVQLIDRATRREMGLCRPPASWWRSCARVRIRFSPDSRWLATRCPGPDVHLIDVLKGRERSVLFSPPY